MKTSLPLLVALIVCLLSVTLVTARAARAESYGSGITLEEATPIGSILANPEAWHGKRVRVEGTVSDVCPMKGCWMSIQTDEAAVRIKVDDGVIVFPVAAKDHQAVAEGIVEIIPLDRERYTAWLRHLADERGEPFDLGTVGNGPYRIVQIRGEGAEIMTPRPAPRPDAVLR